MPANLGLPRTQRWLQAFVLSQAPSDEEALLAPGVRAEHAGDVAEIVLPSHTLTPTERAGIYRGMYLLRMEEALASDYRVLKDWMGHEAFEELIARYVDQFPSRSWTLARLGDHLPEFLAGQPIHQDLAQFELAITQVFDAEETPRLTPEQITAVPQEAWESAILEPISALKIETFDYPVDKLKDAFRDSEPYPAIEPALTRVAIYRHNYKVYWIHLQPAAHRLLSALTTESTLGEAIERTLIEHPDAEDQVFTWFQTWLSKGLFTEVHH